MQFTAKICRLVGRATIADPPSAGGAFSPASDRCLEMRGIIGWAWLTFWDMGSGQELFTLHGHSGILLHMIFSPDGTRLITSGAGQGAVLW